MKKSYAVLWSVVALLSILLLFHNYTVEYFYTVDLNKANRKSVRLNHLVKVKDQELKSMQDEYLTLRNFIAAKQPEIKLKVMGNDEKSYVSRNLASQFTLGSRLHLGKSDADVLLEEGKVMFKQRFFSKAADHFEQLIEYHSSSPQVVEAYFLLAESFYQVKDFKSSIQEIEKMLQLFPESDLTGFILLRMGQIYEAKDQKIHALSIYRTVQASFPNQELVRQATLRIQSMFSAQAASGVLISREDISRKEPSFPRKKELSFDTNKFELQQQSEH